MYPRYVQHRGVSCVMLHLILAITLGDPVMYILQVGKLRLREVTSLVRSSTARAWWSRDSTPARLPQQPGSAQTRPRLLGGSLFPESASLNVEVAAVTPHISTACTRLAHDHWHPEFEKNRDRPGLLTPSSGFASRAFVLI